MCNMYNQCDTTNTKWVIRFIDDSKHPLVNKVRRQREAECVAMLVEDNEDAFVVCDSFTEYFGNYKQALQFVSNKNLKEEK